jgi:hypothetical protein
MQSGSQVIVEQLRPGGGVGPPIVGNRYVAIPCEDSSETTSDELVEN